MKNHEAMNPNGTNNTDDMRIPTLKSRGFRAVLIALGVLCAALGAVGVALPILPTTPFLLAAAFCFARSSDRLNRWFRGTKLYQSHLETLNRGEGMTWPAKLRIMAAVTGVMGLAECFMLRARLLKGSRGALVGCVVMAAVWAAHIIVFCFIIKTCPKQREQDILRESKAKEETVYDAQ